MQSCVSIGNCYMVTFFFIYALLDLAISGVSFLVQLVCKQPIEWANLVLAVRIWLRTGQQNLLIVHIALISSGLVFLPLGVLWLGSGL